MAPSRDRAYRLAQRRLRRDGLHHRHEHRHLGDALLLHPVAAAGWYAAYYLAGIKMNPLVLLGLIVPMFIFLRALTRGPSFATMPLFGIWMVYLVYNLFAGTLHAVHEGPARSMDLIFRHIAGFVGFYMMQAFFTEKKEFKKLTLALIAVGAVSRPRHPVPDRDGVGDFARHGRRR